jgi:hypothetical protein
MSSQLKFNSIGPKEKDFWPSKENYNNKYQNIKKCKMVEILQLLISKDVLHFLDFSMTMDFHPIKRSMAMRNNRFL